MQVRRDILLVISVCGNLLRNIARCTDAFIVYIINSFEGFVSPNGYTRLQFYYPSFSDMCHLSKCSYIFIPYHKNGGEIHNIKRANKFLQNVTEFGYLETLVTIKIAFTQKEGAV